MALRYVLLDYLPPAHPIFEEIQTGGIAARALEHSELPLDYRFTNWMAAIRILHRRLLTGGHAQPVRHRRRPLHTGHALTLRRLHLGWPAVILAVFTMAHLRILVLGGNTAEEIFGGFIFATLLLYCAVCSQTSRDHQLIWAGFAGIMAGILMYEYVKGGSSRSLSRVALASVFRAEMFPTSAPPCGQRACTYCASP